MRTVEEHAAVVSALFSPTPTVSVPLDRARGLVLGADLVATIDLPPFANSAMDGYTVRAADLTGLVDGPVTLPVSQDIPAGRTDTAPLAPGTAARIMTGAPMPDGAEVIVQVERTDGGQGEPGAGTVRIDSAPAPGVHIRGRGEDVLAGATVLTRGTPIGPPQIGVAAALGFAELPVRRPLRVLILSTGTELVEPGHDLGPGQIYESNSAMLAAAVAGAGGEPVVARFVADDVPTFLAALSSAAEAAGGVDLILTSGGVSAGAFEVVKDALTDRGVEFAKVAMQPGMPQGAGRLDGTPVITLPGNPVSSYVSFEVFVRPALRAAMGQPVITRPMVSVPLTGPLDSPAGRRQFRRAHLDAAAGTVTVWGGPGSHLLGWLAGADAMIVVPEDVTHLDAGEHAEVWILD
ncbi:molybdopterin molybdotransferase MoeA [Nakamurella flavida]|uniref:Molybdopterin molybdenumtransferase n=1 Tax=Nakamurella flavida TaxID=363630 RepID=A0A938YRD7_9ACTN|nr:gephyrin-like molybdotransferase Glp [Nakamurella flavida]MBM9478054.1 molybdopterin molybdotransferase MoeA [Nakamurella flavida]MDP9778229.1 molybdopterin molybdotransferase [Nakamurella flavida]